MYQLMIRVELEFEVDYSQLQYVICDVEYDDIHSHSHLLSKVHISRTQRKREEANMDPLRVLFQRDFSNGVSVFEQGMMMR